jgi:hypothetical protein
MTSITKLHQIKSVFAFEVYMLENLESLPNSTKIFTFDDENSSCYHTIMSWAKDDLKPMSSEAIEKEESCNASRCCTLQDYYHRGFRINNDKISAHTNIYITDNYLIYLKKEDVFAQFDAFTHIAIDKYLPEAIRNSYSNAISNMDQPAYILAELIPSNLKDVLLSRNIITPEIEIDSDKVY